MQILIQKYCKIFKSCEKSLISTHVTQYIIITVILAALVCWILLLVMSYYFFLTLVIKIRYILTYCAPGKLVWSGKKVMKASLGVFMDPAPRVCNQTQKFVLKTEVNMFLIPNDINESPISYTSSRLWMSLSLFWRQAIYLLTYGRPTVLLAQCPSIQFYLLVRVSWNNSTAAGKFGTHDLNTFSTWDGDIH